MKATRVMDFPPFTTPPARSVHEAGLNKGFSSYKYNLRRNTHSLNTTHQLNAHLVTDVQSRAVTRDLRVIQDYHKFRFINSLLSKKTTKKTPGVSVTH